jgi:hypothetical protein
MSTDERYDKLYMGGPVDIPMGDSAPVIRVTPDSIRAVLALPAWERNNDILLSLVSKQPDVPETDPAYRTLAAFAEAVAAQTVALIELRAALRAGIAEAQKRGRLTAADLAKFPPSVRPAALSGLGALPVAAAVIIAVGIAFAALVYRLPELITAAKESTTRAQLLATQQAAAIADMRRRGVAVPLPEIPAPPPGAGGGGGATAAALGGAAVLAVVALVVLSMKGR